jgi:hypothetical protein
VHGSRAEGVNPHRREAFRAATSPPASSSSTARCPRSRAHPVTASASRAAIPLPRAAGITHMLIRCVVPGGAAATHAPAIPSGAAVRSPGNARNAAKYAPPAGQVRQSASDRLASRLPVLTNAAGLSLRTASRRSRVSCQSSPDGRHPGVAAASVRGEGPPLRWSRPVSGRRGRRGWF